MELCEQETMILANRDDLSNGYFRFFTTQKKDFLRLKRRLGESYNASSTKISRDSSRETGWEVRVPLAWYSPTTLGVSKPSVLKGRKFTPKNGFKKKETANV